MNNKPLFYSRDSFLWNVLRLAFASASAGVVVGVPAGLGNAVSAASWGNSEPWWSTVSFVMFANGTWMAIFALPVGLAVFGALTLFNARWSAQDKSRLNRMLWPYVFVATALGIVIISLIATMVWGAWATWQGVLTSRASGLGDVLLRVEILTLIGCSCLFTWLTARAAKRHQEWHGTLRLLPID